MHYLVMWSGGIDSTFTLAKLLKETEHEVTAHHIFLANAEKRHHQEMESCKKLLPKLMEIRRFNFTESRIDHSRLPGYPFDMAVVCFEAGVVARAFEKNEKLNTIDAWTIGTHKKEGHWQTRWDVISKSTEAACWPHDAPKFELMPMAEKFEEIQLLDEIGLFEDTWYCRTPIDGKVCETCKTCKEVKMALIDNIDKTLGEERGMAERL